MAYYIEEEAWKCPKHPLKKRRTTTTGVCSICLRERLSILCPHCANMRPCSSTCSASTTASVSTLSSHSSSSGGETALCRSKSVGIPFLKSRNVDSSSRRKTTESEKSNETASSYSSSVKIIDGEETALCRSKSVGIPFLKSRNVSSGDRRKTPEIEKSNKTSLFWWIFKSRKSELESKGNCIDTRIKEFSITAVMRSRSVNMNMTSVSGENDVRYSPGKLKGWYIVSPMKVFRQPPRTPKLVN